MTRRSSSIAVAGLAALTLVAAGSAIPGRLHQGPGLHQPKPGYGLPSRSGLRDFDPPRTAGAVVSTRPGYRLPSRRGLGDFRPSAGSVGQH